MRKKLLGASFILMVFFLSIFSFRMASVSIASEAGGEYTASAVVGYPENTSITVLSPNGGEKWVVGNTYDITWSSEGVDTVSIQLNGKTEADAIVTNQRVIATDVSASLGKIAWVVPTDITLGSEYKIDVYSPTRLDVGTLDESDDYFSIVEGEKSITVISPNGGEEIKLHEPFDITWNSYGVKDVYIYLWFTDGGTCKIANTLATYGKYSAVIMTNEQCENIPKTITPGQYKIFITTDIEGVQDSSDDYFSIVKYVTCVREKSGVDCGDYLYEDYCENFSDGTGYANTRKCSASQGNDCSLLVNVDRIFCPNGCKDGACITLTPTPIPTPEPTPIPIPEPKPDICTEEYNPVCGKDGKTYSNKCYLEKDGAELDYYGKCRTSCVNIITTIENPTRDKYWEKLGVDPSVELDILKYKIQWFSGDWSDWYYPGQNDLDWKTNYDGTKRLVWSYFTDHKHEYMECVKAEERKCTDSDGGKNYYTKGTTILGSDSKVDGCSMCTEMACPPENPDCNFCSEVIEYYCDNSENKIESAYYDCPHGCKDGACISPTICTAEYNPVCGKDGKTYSNKCYLEKDGVELDYYGECQETTCRVAVTCEAGYFAKNTGEKDSNGCPIMKCISKDGDSEIDFLRREIRNLKTEIIRIKKEFLSRERNLVKKIDQALSNRLKGKILLQVEEKGEAWYVSPTDEKKHYLGRPDDAFSVMRELGLGISEKDYDSFNGVASARLSGRILLRVESVGEAYYINPVDLKMHYLGRPADAFDIMRGKGLGITNDNLRKIGVGD